MEMGTGMRTGMAMELEDRDRMEARMEMGWGQQ